VNPAAGPGTIPAGRLNLGARSGRFSFPPTLAWASAAICRAARTCAAPSALQGLARDVMTLAIGPVFGVSGGHQHRTTALPPATPAPVLAHWTVGRHRAPN
jgi:hypothetical protein